MKLKNLLKSKYSKIFLVGIFLRIFLSLSTFHPDIRAFQLGGNLIAHGYFFNLYDYLANCASDNQLVAVFGRDYFIYPPAIYTYHSVYNFIFGLVFGQGVVNGFQIEKASDFGNIWFNIHLLLLKIPYILFDGLTAIFITKLFENPREKMLAFILWVFNPINLYATYMMGQFDIIPAFFIVLALVLAQQKKLEWAALSLGVGAAFKISPFLLLIPLLTRGETVTKRIQIFLLGILPYIFSLSIFISSSGFRSSALVAGQTLKSLYAAIPVSGGESLLLFPVFLVFLYLLFIYQKNPLSSLWKEWFLIMLLFFVFTHYHPQWFVWLTPFMIIDLIYSKFKTIWAMVLAVISFVGLLFLFDPSLTSNIFAPLIPSLREAPSIWSLVHLKIDQTLARSLLQSLLASSALFYFYLSLKKTNSSSS